MTYPEPVSPCVSVCKIDPAAGWCRGCLRTRDEIRAWGKSDSAGRHAILDRVSQRRAEFPAACCPAVKLLR